MDVTGTKSDRPLTGTEREVSMLWEELLEVTDVSPESDFFVLGGHSLAAMRLINRLERRFGIEVPLLVVFEHSTLETLGAAIDSMIQKEVRSSRRNS